MRTRICLSFVLFLFGILLGGEARSWAMASPRPSPPCFEDSCNAVLDPAVFPPPALLGSKITSDWPLFRQQYLHRSSGKGSCKPGELHCEAARYELWVPSAGRDPRYVVGPKHLRVRLGLNGKPLVRISGWFKKTVQVTYEVGVLGPEKLAMAEAARGMQIGLEPLNPVDGRLVPLDLAYDPETGEALCPGGGQSQGPDDGNGDTSGADTEQIRRCVAGTLYESFENVPTPPAIQERLQYEEGWTMMFLTVRFTLTPLGERLLKQGFRSGKFGFPILAEIAYDQLTASPQVIQATVDRLQREHNHSATIPAWSERKKIRVSGGMACLSQSLWQNIRGMSQAATAGDCLQYWNSPNIDSYF